MTGEIKIKYFIWKESPCLSEWETISRMGKFKGNCEYSEGIYRKWRHEGSGKIGDCNQSIDILGVLFNAPPYSVL